MAKSSYKLLALALAAMLALSAAIATAVSADEFTGEKYPVALTGYGTVLSDQFKTTNGTANCKKSAYVGTAGGPTTSVSLTPSYSECTAFGFPATIDINGCKYVFNIGAGTTGDADLVCEAGKSITVTAISAGTLKCVVHVSSQSDIAGTVSYSNVQSGSNRIIFGSVTLSGIDYSHAKGTGLGACTAGSAINGTLEAEALVTGEQAPGSTHIGIFLS